MGLFHLENQMVINRQAAFTLLENTYLREMLQELSQQRDSLLLELADLQQEMNLINSDSYIVAHRRSMEY
jgi:signal transduction protein with GAF and PtsI domain